MKQINKKDNELKAYETDASQIKGDASKVILPENVSEVKIAIQQSKRITPRGGGTGLVGGCVPLDGDVVLDLSKLNRISNLDEQRKTIEVEAGVILDELQSFLAKYGLEFPVNPSSHAVCTIGGMIATDAVGSRAVKYGRTSRWVQWVEVVDSKGKSEVKGATELSDYPGMEGITGVIVKAGLKLINRVHRTASIFGSESLNETIDKTRELKRNKDVSMIEFLDKKISKMLGLEEKYHLIIEYESDEGEVKGKNYEKVMDLRDKVYPLLAKDGYTRIEDPKILLDRVDKLIRWLETKNVPVFGHISVGIFHPCFSKEQVEAGLVVDLMKVIKNLHGQITGEHGIGLVKKEFMEFGDKKILINIKKRTDTESKFNMGKVL